MLPWATKGYTVGSYRNDGCNFLCLLLFSFPIYQVHLKIDFANVPILITMLIYTWPGIAAQQRSGTTGCCEDSSLVGLLNRCKFHGDNVLRVTDLLQA